MSWSKIKKAINSSLGTPDFKPLDKIVLEAFEFIKTKLSNLTNSLTSGENEFIVKKAKNAETADKALQMAIPNMSVNNNNVTDIITLDNLKAGIYAITWAKYDEVIASDRNLLTNYVTSFYYLSDSIISGRVPPPIDGENYLIEIANIPIYPIAGALSSGKYIANIIYYDSKQKQLNIYGDNKSIVLDIAFIKVNNENIII